MLYYEDFKEQVIFPRESFTNYIHGEDFVTWKRVA